MSHKVDILVEAHVNVRCDECGDIIPIELYMIKPMDNFIEINVPICPKCKEKFIREIEDLKEELEEFRNFE